MSISCRTLKTLAFCLLAVQVSTGPVFADEIRTERVAFPKGSYGTSLQGQIQGYDSAHYLVGAQEGQTLSVDMQTSNTATYFNLVAPDDEVAFYVGSAMGNSYEGPVPASGDIVVEVYMMRSAARREEIAQYDLKISVR